MHAYTENRTDAAGWFTHANTQTLTHTHTQVEKDPVAALSDPASFCQKYSI